MRKGWVGLLVAGASLVGPAGAGATGGVNYCVPSNSIPNCPAGGTSEPTISSALSASQSEGGHNKIFLGPQSFNENSLVDNSGNQVDIIGEGAGKTTIAPAGGSSTSVLTLDDFSSTVSDLAITIPAGSGNTGLTIFGASASSIAVTPAAGATSSTGMSTEDGATVTASTITADTGMTASFGLNLARDRITATTGVSVSGQATIDDSLIRTVPGASAETAVSADAFDTSSNVAMRHDTLIGDGSTSSVGVSCGARGVITPASCDATIDSSIIRSFQAAITTAATGTFMYPSSVPASANATVTYSDFDPSGDTSTNGVEGSGSITEGSGDLNVDPLFASTDPANALAYQLTTPSPVIDQGDTTLGSGEPTTDLAGAPRVVGGRVGASPRSDIGAFEYQPKPPVVSARASRSLVGPRTPVTFTATGTPVNPGDTITSISWRFDDGSSASGARVTHAFSRPGRHTATATVKDLNGFSVTASVFVTAAGKPTVSGSLGGLAKGDPALQLKVTHGVSAPAIKSLSVGLPGGLAFSRGAFVSHRRCTGTGRHRKCTTTITVKGLSVAGGRVQSVRLDGGRLVITLKAAANTVSVGAVGPLLTENGALQKNVKKGTVRSLTAIVAVTDANRTSTTITLKLKPH